MLELANSQSKDLDVIQLDLDNLLTGIPQVIIKEGGNHFVRYFVYAPA